MTAYYAIASGLLLMIIGMWGFITRKNLIRIIVAFSLFDTGIHVVLVGIGYIKGRTAPIIDSSLSAADAATKSVDPVPQALVLTAIVIGLAVTLLMLTYAVKLYEKKKSL
ncbi:cation:proton antiporter subunit C, partial [bacterium]|nr:cation:proton antiporter subunit C [bacterium]